MRRWGLVITAFYAAIVLLLLAPGGALLIKPLTTQRVLYVYQAIPKIHEWWWPAWVYVGILVAGQALLLFLSVDTSWRHAKPRQHLAVTIALASFFAAVLSWSALFSLEVAVYGDHEPPLWNGKTSLFLWTALGIWIGLWVIWGGIFYQYYRDASNMVSQVVTWLLRGSVLELLIAVPAHVIVRQRGDCSAPGVTAFGIVTGFAIMLMCFGPGVLALYKKKIDAYSRKREQRIESRT